MADLTGKTPQDTYKDLLQVSNSNSGVDGTLRSVEDGEGTTSALKISSDAVEVDNVNINGNTISSSDTDGDLVLTPNGAGDIILDGVNWPQADGTANQVLQTDGAGQTSWSSVINKDTVSVTAGETLAQGDIVYLKSDGKVWKATATGARAASRVFGVVVAAVSANIGASIVVSGETNSFTLLTPGSIYYVDTAAGDVTATAPTGSSQRVVKVGIAISATNMLVQPEFIVERD